MIASVMRTDGSHRDTSATSRPRWRVARRRGRLTALRRRGTLRSTPLVWLCLCVLIATSLASCGGLDVFFPGWQLGFLVLFLWPTPHETLLVSPRRVIWRDRLLAARCWVSPEKVRVAVVTVGAESGLLLRTKPGEIEHLLALGPADEIQALAETLDEALRRACAASDARPPVS